MTMYKLLWIFFLYAFLGWCSEVVFAACKSGQFVNRGFLLGPVCPDLQAAKTTSVHQPRKA